MRLIRNCLLHLILTSLGNVLIFFSYLFLLLFDLRCNENKFDYFNKTGFFARFCGFALTVCFMLGYFYVVHVTAGFFVSNSNLITHITKYYFAFFFLNIVSLLNNYSITFSSGNFACWRSSVPSVAVTESDILFLRLLFVL